MRRPNQQIGPGIGYVGSQASFEAVSPLMQSMSRGGRGRPPEVVTKQKLLSDPIYGIDQADRNNGNEKQAIRALVKHGRELVMHSGSSVTIRLDAPFKIGLAPPQAQMDTLAAPAESTITGGRRFAPSGGASDNQSAQPNPASENPLPGILPDTPHAQTSTVASPAQGTAQQQQPQQAPTGPGSF